MSKNALAAGNYPLKYVIWENTIFPYFNGYDPTSNFTAAGVVTGSKPYTFALNTPFHMWIPCFKGMRGSMYWHYESQNSEFKQRPSFEVRRDLNDPQVSSGRLVWTSNGASVASASLSEILNGEMSAYDFTTGSTSARSASTLVSPFDGEGKSVLLPNMFNYRFDSTRVGSMVTNQGKPRVRRESVKAMLRYSPAAAGNANVENNIFIRRYFSIGPDFTVFFFLCVPRIYRYAAIPQGL